MSTAAAYNCFATPKAPSTHHVMDVTISCPPPPRRAASESFSHVDNNMCPMFPSLDSRNNGFFLAPPSSPDQMLTMDHYDDQDDQELLSLSFQIPMLKPRASSQVRRTVPISTLKPRPAKSAAAETDTKMSSSLPNSNSYQLSMNNKRGTMRRSSSFHSPAA